MRASDALDDAARQLGSRLEAQLLLAHATGSDRVALLAHPERQITPAQAVSFSQLVERRRLAEPIAYLLGEREFYGRTFRVDRRALIPRPETELLVDLGIAAVQRLRVAGAEPTVLEIGTGSGAIAVSLALETRQPVIATELSWEALTLARENAQRFGAPVSFLQTDLVSGLRAPVHVLLANLPYVPKDRQLPRDVRDYEPPMAIFGGPRGTELIERLLEDARPLLAPGGEIAVELDEEAQAQPVAGLARELYPGSEVGIHLDAGGYDRVVRVLHR